MPYLQECVALEYYADVLGAALARECVSAQKPGRGKSFSLSLPIALPAEIAAFVSKHPAFLEHLREDAKSLQVEISAGEKLRAFSVNFSHRFHSGARRFEHLI